MVNARGVLGVMSRVGIISFDSVLRMAVVGDGWGGGNSRGLGDALRFVRYQGGKKLIGCVLRGVCSFSPRAPEKG